MLKPFIQINLSADILLASIVINKPAYVNLHSYLKFKRPATIGVCIVLIGTLQMGGDGHVRSQCFKNGDPTSADCRFCRKATNHVRSAVLCWYMYLESTVCIISSPNKIRVC